MQNHKFYFIRYGTDGLSFELWDNTHHRIIRSRDVFKEKRDRLQVREDDSKFVELDDVNEKSV